MDSTNVAPLFGTALTKQLDVTWAAGTNAGGRFSGVSEANSTWYYVFAILKDTDGSVDYGFDTSLTASHIPAGYTKYRLIGFVYNDASSALRAFTWRDGGYWWALPSLDADSSTQSTSSVSYALASVPPGISVIVEMIGLMLNATANVMVYVRNPNDTDSAPSATAAPGHSLRNPVAGGTITEQLRITTDTSQQIAARASAASTTFRAWPLAFYYDFGRNN